MPKENEYYRDNLTRIIERYPRQELLNKKQVCDYLGRDARTVSIKDKPRRGSNTTGRRLE